MTSDATFPSNVRAFGAVGDGVRLDSPSINQAIAACARSGGGTVLIPAGTYMIGTVQLLDNVTLHLEAGAVLKGSADLGDYRVLPYTSEGRSTALIVADHARNVAITGRGTIDGNGAAFAIPDQADTWRDFDPARTRQGGDYLLINDDPADGPVKHKPRPGILVLFVHCSDVLVRDIKLVDAPNWCLHVACSTDVLLTGLDIKSSLLLPNSGGLDVSLSRNVRISDCTISGGDDAIAFSPCADGFGDGIAEHITVQNCVLLARSAAIRIGWGAHAFRNLLFNNIVIRDSNRGILINLRYGELIENVVFSNIVIESRLYRGKWWGKGEPIHISAVAEHADEKRPRRLRNVTFSNVTAVGDHGVVVYADDNSTIEDVRFDNVRLTLRPGALQESFGGNFDLRPIWDPARQVFAHDIPVVYARGVRSLVLRDVRIEREVGLPAFCRHAIECEDFGELELENVRIMSPEDTVPLTDPAIMLRRGRTAMLHHVRMDSATTPLLEVDDVTDVRVQPMTPSGQSR